MNTRDLQYYVEKFTNLTREADRKLGPAPNKPVLLLAVIAMIESGRIVENRIMLAEELEVIFRSYWPRATAREPNIASPFYHLSGEGFWRHQANAGRDKDLQNIQGKSKGRLRELIDYAYLDRELFDILSNVKGREVLRQALIQRYFPEEQEEIDRISAEVRETNEYEALLLGQTEPSFEPIKRPEQICQRDVRIRREGFRRAIMRLYDYRCSVCQLGVVTAEGHSAAGASHIISHDVSHNDDVRNGISLCPLHRWAFIEGFISLCDSYHVILSGTLLRGSRTERALIDFDGKLIRRPNREELWPAQKAMEWHRTYVFKRG